MTKEDNPQKGYYNEAEDPEQLLQQPPDVGSTTAPVSPTHTILPTNNGTSHQPFSSYEDVLNYMNEHMESKDEEKKRKKREKTQQIITGIADMGRALANLYYTSQHAPNSYNGEVLSEKLQQRIDKAKAEREKERDWHLNYAMNMAKLKQGDYRTNLEEEKAKEQQAYRDKQLDLYYQREERMKQEADRKERMADWQKEYQQGQLDLKKAQIELRKWIEQGKMSRAQINQNLASWKRTKRYILDDRGKKIGEEEERIVMNPDGTLTTESSIKYDDGQGGGTSAGSSSKQKTPTMLQKNNNSKTPSMLQ